MTYIDPVDVSPKNYKVLLEDERVRVLEMYLKPGEMDNTHSHPFETVYFVKGGRLRIALPDGSADEVELPDGAVLSHGPWTHQVANVGDSDVYGIIVEAKQDGQTPADVEASIRKADDRFESGFARQDAESIAALYTAKSMLLPAGAESVEGTASIQVFWQEVIDKGVRKADLDMIDVEHYGDTAIEVGKYVLGGSSGQMLDRGKYLVVWKRENGEWKIYRDSRTSSLPAESLGSHGPTTNANSHELDTHILRS